MIHSNLLDAKKTTKRKNSVKQLHPIEKATVK